MARLSSIPRNSALAALLCALPALAVEVPAGSEIEIRLKTKVSTVNARAGDPLDAIVIAPVMVGNVSVIPAGAAVYGTVGKATHPEAADQRAVLLLNFTGIEVTGSRVALNARVLAVDNAREKIDDSGEIHGILASETVTGKMDSGISKLSDRFSGLAGVLSVAKGAVLKEADSDIAYSPGVEMTLKLLAPLSVAKPGGAGLADSLEPIREVAELRALIDAAPFQTVAENPPKPSDITNMMLVGTREQVEAAFTAAGWSNAAALSRMAKLETLKALAEDRGYDEAPVSVLLLDGKPPDLVFEKLNNTFARRHHLRVWLRPETFGGRPVWMVAATHDIGINFSEQNRTFIHRVDSDIDRERNKVANDLVFSGRVASFMLVDRSNVPQHSQNATGDNLATDAKIAVLILR